MNQAEKNIQRIDNQTTGSIIQDIEVQKQVLKALSLEWVMESDEYKDFMKNMMIHLPELNELLNSKQEITELLKQFDEIIRKCSQDEAFVLGYIRHGMIHNEVVLNIFYRHFDLTQWFFWVPWNITIGEDFVVNRTLKINEITTIQITNRSYFLDYLESLLKKVFELHLGKQNVK